MNNVDNIAEIHNQATWAAAQAACKFFNERLGGRDQYSCGFAWVEVPEVRGNTRLGKTLAKVGFSKTYGRKGMTLWNPSGHPCQNVDTKFHGAVAYAKVLEQHGIRAIAMDRLD
jgi:hypothetical protein